MLYIFLIFLLYVNYIYSLPKNIYKFTNINFYESFTNPKECFQLFHNNQISPYYLALELEYQLMSYIFGFKHKSIKQNYSLKRINHECNNTVILTTLLQDIKSMILNIRIRTYEKEVSAITEFYYIFNRNFYPYTYTILSISNQFGLNIKILDSIMDYLPKYKNLSTEKTNYLRSLVGNDGNICLIIPSEHAVVLLPTYKLLIPNGLIAGLRVEFVDNNTVNSYMDFIAYECKYNDLNTEEMIYFLYDIIEYEIRFKIIYWKFELGNCERYFIESEFLNSKIADFYSIEYLSKDDKKVFLVESRKFNVNCDDGTHRTVFKTINGVVYRAISDSIVHISRGVRRTAKFSHSPTSPCTT